MTKTQRQKQLLERIQLAADMAQKSPALRATVAQRILRMAIELAADAGLNDEKRKVLGENLFECGQDSLDTFTFVSRNELYINGTIDVREFAKRFTW